MTKIAKSRQELNRRKNTVLPTVAFAFEYIKDIKFY